ncbi:sigma factor G inhibitor Gin [Halalkalibacter sp. APA_J-10(15)]|uniref:sigma factor G inhibitor Gin n=1 Tax=Halalkalibacter sp. APA_J-10(15) TaxID=2933805 RepID=UPI001FF5292C|nr:sigma factor G inhibitor Gin [Halalkalibacter sp. APA_J-10(15)]MCK0473600.1 sigma factor G inhibitor Gin [Halalkalibacter sp. APA_J-10(15)]
MVRIQCSVCKKWCVETIMFWSVSLCDECEKIVVQTEIGEGAYDQIVHTFSETMKK